MYPMKISEVGFLLLMPMTSPIHRRRIFQRFQVVPSGGHQMDNIWPGIALWLILNGQRYQGQ